MSKKYKDPIRKEYKKLLEELRLVKDVAPRWGMLTGDESSDDMNIRWIKQKIKDFEEKYPEVAI